MPYVLGAGLFDTKIAAATVKTATNFNDALREKVIRKFIESYEKGITPNPCSEAKLLTLVLTKKITLRAFVQFRNSTSHARANSEENYMINSQ